VKLYHPRPPLDSYWSQLPLEKVAEPFIVGSDQNLPELAGPSEQVNHTQKIDVVKTLQWIIEQRSLKRWISHTKIQGQENAHSESIQLGARHKCRRGVRAVSRNSVSDLCGDATPPVAERAQEINDLKSGVWVDCGENALHKRLNALQFHLHKIRCRLLECF
jgi:hypothetical protein